MLFFHETRDCIIFSHSSTPFHCRNSVKVALSIRNIGQCISFYNICKNLHAFGQDIPLCCFKGVSKVQNIQFVKIIILICYYTVQIEVC